MNSDPSQIIGQTDANVIPRYAGLTTFARLPRLEDVSSYDVAVLGIPFDTGTSYRPGARFGPAHVRQSSRLLRPYNPTLQVAPFGVQQVVDAGDVPCNPFDIPVALGQIERDTDEILGTGARVLAIGGDHTVALPLLRSVARRHGPVALIHFDAHLDTWDTIYGSRYVHGTPFRRAQEEGLLLPDRSAHIGVRSSVYSSADFDIDASLGFVSFDCASFDREGVPAILERVHARLGDQVPVYVSIDIDVLDPAHAPGTGTPEAGGMTSRELLAVLRGFTGLNLVGADIVEVAPSYDHAELTGIAAANVGYELVSLMALTLA
jgi:agmatinase